MEHQQSIVENGCLHQLFEAAVDRAPGAVALIDGASEVTYAELERRTNQLARHLLRLGVGPETLVGICTARTADMVVGMLGALKAGAAYLSLDPSYPRERLAFMLEDAGSPVVLTQERLLGALQKPGSRPTIGSPVFLCLDRDAPALAAESPERPEAAAGPRSLAYAIYTSGSTGRPKGVAIEHRSAVALCHWARKTFPAADFAGMLASTSINFDLSVFEIFVPLAWGGTVILAENALALPRLPAAGKVTFVNTVPSAMAELLRAGGLPPSVRTVGLAGEPLKRVLADRIYATGTVRGVYNLYGPSEDTTYSTWVRVAPDDPEEPTIGRPVSGTELYLLDAAQQPAAPGEAGEVFLGGAGLARGYHGRPELTAERFLPDPFSGRPGSRLYRVGDLGRFRPDGEVQFLGRVDHQVKIRGFRIELGEIEAALSRHPEVSEAVVTAALAPGDDNDRRLVAYVESTSMNAAGLRSFLRERLPAHMVPSLFTVLETLPRTPNGKVDRKALPEPDWTAAGSEEETAAPRTPMEELVAGLWCEALGAARVGLHDHFLELGGHSLLAARLVSRLRDTLGVETDISTLFAHPTVAGFAAVLQRTAQARSGRTVELPPLLPVPRQGDLPASTTQARIWFLDQIQPGSPMSNVAIAAQLTGPLRPAVLEAALRDIVRRHEALRTTFDDAGGPVTQKIAPRLDLDLPVVDLTALPAGVRDAETGRLSAARAADPFDLRRGPLLRADLLRLGAEEHRLLLVMHHMTSDDWSVWVLFRELGSLYRAFAAGLPHPLPAPPSVQYADFAVWQSRWLATPGALDDFTAHARGLLADVPRSIDLPADRPHPPIQTFRGRRHHFTLPDALAPGLRDLSRREGATLFMALLAAFEVQVGRLTGRERFLLGSPTANRGRTELESLIGAFADTAVWRADLAGGPSFRALLHRVRDSVLAGSRFDAAPFELIPAELRPGGDTGSTQFLQLIFALQTVPRPEPELAPGLGVRTWELDTGTTKVDLSLFLWNDEGLTGAVEYSTDLFDESTIVRLVDQYQRLLEGALAAPDRPVTELDLLSPGQRWQIVGEWNDAFETPRYVFDAAHQPSPIGVVGDLCQGSTCTGDRARFRRDGVLEILTPLPAVLESSETETERGALEELIAGVWSQLLGLEHVGLRQSFFTLGGHSMLATRMVLRLRDLLKLDLPFRMLFEHPTVAGLAQAIRSQRRAADLPLEPGNRGERPPLSFAQQRLWFIERLDPGTAVLNIPAMYSLRGSLQMGALKEALFEILRRHEALRTTIAVVDEQPFQVIHPPSAPDLPVVDLTSLPAERRESEADRAATLEGSRPFDLDGDALVRFLLLRSGVEDHRLLATFHHLVADGGSMALFEQELAALYAGSPLADLPVQYADYAAWQRRTLSGDYLARQISFWRERLAAPLPVLQLPTDRPRPEVPSSRGAETKTLLPPELTAALRELSRREGSTLYITLLAAYLALLHRATGQRDLTLGVPVSLRDRAQVENLIGLFVNTLVIRAEVKPEATFRDHLAHVRERALEAFAHWDVPFERLVEELQPERGPHDTPFFQLMFAFQSLPETTHHAADLELRPLDLTTGTSQFELTLYLLDSGNDLTALAEYRTELYDAATIEKMLGAFQSLLEAAVANPEIPVSDLPLQGWPTAITASAPVAPQPTRPSAQEADAAREERLTEIRSQLSGEQRDLLRQRLQRRKG